MVHHSAETLAARRGSTNGTSSLPPPAEAEDIPMQIVRCWLVPFVVTVAAACRVVIADPVTPAEITPILKDLGAKVEVAQRPTWKKSTANSVKVTLVPQTDAGGAQVVS